jgi:hypothetical protein
MNSNSGAEPLHPALYLFILADTETCNLPTLSNLTTAELFSAIWYPWYLPPFNQLIDIAEDTSWYLNYE